MEPAITNRADSRDASSQTPLTWRRFKFPQSLLSYASWMAVFFFIGYSIEYLRIPLDRIPSMFERMGTVLGTRYYPADMGYIMDWGYMTYVLQTIQMAYLGALFGLLLSIPLGWFGAYNVTPSRRFIYPVARLVTMGFRAVHEMIWAILFVSILGYGMLAGVLALTLFCAGFAGKLFAEEIEAINMGPVEAMQATGANLFKTVIFGVIPQVRVAFTGIAIYTWDVAFRAATVVGFVGAGGMGWYLKRAVLQIESERVAAIIISIIVLVLMSEIFSAYARDRVMKMK